MSHYPSKKTFFEWTTFGIFLFLTLSGFMVCRGDETSNAWQSADVEQAKTVDNDDLEVKVAAKSSSGIVWGTTKPKTTAESATPAITTPITTPIVTAPVPTPAPAPALPSAEKAQTAAAPALPAAPAAAKAEKYLLKSSRKKGSTDLVETLLEVTGEVKQVDNALKETKEKMEVVAGFRYEEQIHQMDPAGSLVGIRQYNLAKSKMKIGDQTKMPELSSELQTIVCSLEKDHVALFSPAGSLRGEQLLLIEDIPGNTLTLDRLLPSTEVAIGESWQISESVLRSFLAVDAITSSNVEAVLTAVADNMAMVEVVGDVSGVYLGAATEMSVRAKFQFDLSIQRINWLGVMIEENRSIGHVGPGLDLVARLQVKVSPLDTPQMLTDAAKITLNTTPSAAVLQLKYDGGKGPWRFAHDRSWYNYQDDPQATVLRKLINGELVAQCNIADMGTVDLKTMTTLEKFQQDLINGLGQNFGKVAAASEYENKHGYKIYKVLLDGMVDDLSLRWIYHLVTDKDGKQSVVVFVVEAAMLEQFADADDVLLETYRMGK